MIPDEGGRNESVVDELMTFCSWRVIQVNRRVLDVTLSIFATSLSKSAPDPLICCTEA